MFTAIKPISLTCNSYFSNSKAYNGVPEVTQLRFLELMNVILQIQLNRHLLTRYAITRCSNLTIYTVPSQQTSTYSYRLLDANVTLRV